MRVLEWIWYRFTGPWDLSLGREQKKRGRPAQIRVFETSTGQMLAAFYDQHELAEWIDAGPGPDVQRQDITVQMFGPFSNRKMGRGLSDDEAAELVRILDGFRDRDLAAAAEQTED